MWSEIGRRDLLDANAVPRAAAEGYVEFVDIVEVRVALEPTLGTELERVAEDVRVVQDVWKGHGDWVAWGNDELFVLESLVGCHERQARSEEGAEAKSFADDGRLLWYVSLYGPWATIRNGERNNGGRSEDRKR